MSLKQYTVKLGEAKFLHGSFTCLPEVSCKFESEFSDRLHEEGNMIHYTNCSVPKTKNNPFAQERYDYSQS